MQLEDTNSPKQKNLPSCVELAPRLITVKKLLTISHSNPWNSLLLLKEEIFDIYFNFTLSSEMESDISKMMLQSSGSRGGGREEGRGRRGDFEMILRR